MADDPLTLRELRARLLTLQAQKRAIEAEIAATMTQVQQAGRIAAEELQRAREQLTAAGKLLRPVQPSTPAQQRRAYNYEVRRMARRLELAPAVVRSSADFRYWYKVLAEQRRLETRGKADMRYNGTFARALEYFGYRSAGDLWDVGDTPKVSRKRRKRK